MAELENQVRDAGALLAAAAGERDELLKENQRMRELAELATAREIKTSSASAVRETVLREELKAASCRVSGVESALTEMRLTSEAHHLSRVQDLEALHSSLSTEKDKALAVTGELAEARRLDCPGLRAVTGQAAEALRELGFRFEPAEAPDASAAIAELARLVR